MERDSIRRAAESDRGADVRPDFYDPAPGAAAPDARHRVVLRARGRVGCRHVVG